MQNTLQEYIPRQAIPMVLNLLKHDHLTVKIKNERKTRHGDYMRLPNGKHQITVNCPIMPASSCSKIWQWYI